MDIDALKITRGSQWDRLHQLARKNSLTGQEIEELSDLYQSVTGDLAHIRSSQADPDIVRLLSRDLAMARATLTGTRASAGAVVSRWLRVDLPAALYQIRWWTVAAATAFVVIAAAHCAYLLLNPELFAQIGTPMELEKHAKVDFVQYYHQDTNAEFASSVWVNNSYVAAQMIAGGITGFFPAYVLYSNAESTGVTAAIVFSYAGVWHFFRYILPHGMPELTAVFIACAAGFRVFWALVIPGHLSRGQAVARAGRAMLTVALGMVILLFLSGLLEGFVTPSGLPDWVRLLSGFLITVGLWVYTLTLGKRAYEAGYTGDIDQEAAGYSRASI